MLLNRRGEMIVTVSKWGNSLGIRIPSDITVATGISEGDKVEITGIPMEASFTEKEERHGKAESLWGTAQICES